MSFVHSVNTFPRLRLFVPWTLGLVQIEQFITSGGPKCWTKLKRLYQSGPW